MNLHPWRSSLDCTEAATAAGPSLLPTFLPPPCRDSTPTPSLHRPTGVQRSKIADDSCHGAPGPPRGLAEAAVRRPAPLERSRFLDPASELAQQPAEPVIVIAIASLHGLALATLERAAASGDGFADNARTKSSREGARRVAKRVDNASTFTIRQLPTRVLEVDHRHLSELLHGR